MTITLSVPRNEPSLKPRITVVGVGGAGGNAIDNMINARLEGVEFVVANTDAQALHRSLAERRVQLGISVTHGLGAGSRPDIGRAAAEETLEEILEHLDGSHMAFVTAGLGGGTGTGAAPIIARAARERGILTVGVVTKPFHFEGAKRMRIAEAGLEEMQHSVDTLIVIPNQNLFRIANETTTFAEAFRLADQVLYSGVRGVTDLMVMPGLINLDFADIRTVMGEMGKAMMGTGEGEGPNRAIDAAESAISNPLLDDVSMKGARSLLVNITGSENLTLFEVDAAANRIREEADREAHVIFGSTFDGSLEGRMRVSVVATGIDREALAARPAPLSLVVDRGGTTARDDEPRRPAAASPALPAPSAERTRGEANIRGAGLFATAGRGGEPAGTSPMEEKDRASGKDAGTPAGGEARAAGEAPGDAGDSAFPSKGTPPAPVSGGGIGETTETAAPPAGSLPTGGPEASLDPPFIAPPPVEPSGRVATVSAPEPFAAAALANGARRGERETPRRPSLFERMTGTGRAKRTPANERRDSVPEGNQAGMDDLLDKGVRKDASPPEEDLLDIPAFLRRQMN